MARHFDRRRFYDPFIAKREMPGTNGEEVNTKICYISRYYKWLVGGAYMNYEL
jgi:hypothetical protein